MAKNYKIVKVGKDYEIEGIYFKSKTNISGETTHYEVIVDTNKINIKRLNISIYRDDVLVSFDETTYSNNMTIFKKNISDCMEELKINIKSIDFEEFTLFIV